MKLKSIIDRAQHEAHVLTGEETRDITYVSQNQFPDGTTARDAFNQSVKKLFDVNGWSALSSFTADFHLHDHAGIPKPVGSLQLNDCIQIALPGPVPENWVRVVHVAIDEKRAEFAVRPSNDPRKPASGEVEHFFDRRARSTFRVELAGKVITASEIGEDEGINNQEPQAGGRAVINTVIAEAGWLFYQKIQWKLLTDYLVHV